MHSWQHAVPAPFSLVAHYDHPIAYLIHVFLPTYLPAALFRFHLLTYLLYLAVVSLEETFAYSGYNMLPSAFVLGGIARRQEKHLMGGEYGNYGCFGLVDFAMGTSIGEDLIDDVIDEAEEKKVAKKTKKKVKGVGRKVLKKHAPKERDAREREEEEEEDEVEGKERAAEEAEGEEEGEEEEEEEAPPKPKTKRIGANRSGRKGADTNEDDANTNATEEKNETSLKRSSRIRKGDEKSSEEDAEVGAQDEEERSKPKAKAVARKGSQKSKTAGRPRKRSEEDGE